MTAESALGLGACPWSHVIGMLGTPVAAEAVEMGGAECAGTRTHGGAPEAPGSAEGGRRLDVIWENGESR
jgi:hypothetical protein